MKVFETGKIPVHIALSKLYAEEDLELSSTSAIKHEIEDCYQKYTPAQNIPFTSEDATRIQRETALSWSIYYNNKYAESDETERDDDLVISDLVNTAFDSITDELHPIANNTRAIRRKQTAKHNRRLRNAVIIDYKGAKSRFNVDFYYTAVINRRKIDVHKSRSGRYAKLFKKAEKKNLITIDELKAS